MEREEKYKLIEELGPQKCERCRICLKELKLIELSNHSNFCQEKIKVEENIKKLDSEIIKECMRATGIKNKLKFEMMVYSRPKKLIKTVVMERASYSGSGGVKNPSTRTIPIGQKVNTNIFRSGSSCAEGEDSDNSKSWV